jgi:hypothetical protein
MTSLGGGFQGISAKQTITNYKDGQQTSTRDIVRRSWNTAFASGTVNGYKRRVTPFRAVNNSGDFLVRQNYNSEGANPDSTGIPSASTNPKFVADSSDYTKFKRQVSVNRNYNDLANGGDEHNASVTFLWNARS